MKTIREIIFVLEERTETLLNEFKEIERLINDWTTQNPMEDIENSPEVKPYLEDMVKIFVELRPIEKLIRFKFKEYNIIFDKLSQIIHEKDNGKFFSLLSNSPVLMKRKYTKKLVGIQEISNNSSDSNEYSSSRVEVHDIKQ